MPRIARIVVTGYPYHITQRGNYKQNTFDNSDDYKKYLLWIKKYCEKYGVLVLTYCLMPNHVHFIVVPEESDSLARTFNVCHMRYSQYYNEKNNQRGHLWQGRFYSCVLGENHLYEAVRYVENNPKRARLVEKSEDWEWSSARAHLGKGDNYIKLSDIKKYLSIGDWNEYLNEKEDSVVLKDIRKNTLTGRPSGRENFITKIEGIVGTRLRALKRGRPKNK
ncbi:MAG: transposase [Candidatus Omnitrophota bacterium]